MGSTATPRLKACALQRPPRRMILSGIPAALRIGGRIPNPLVSTGDGPPVRLDTILAGRTAVLTTRPPDPARTDFCRRHGLVLVRISSTHAAGTTGQLAADPDAGGSTFISPATGGARLALRALAVLGSNPALTVVVRPDHVIAAVEPRNRLPRLPWPIPATPSAGLQSRLTQQLSPITPARSRQHARRGSHVRHDLPAHDRGLSPSRQPVSCWASRKTAVRRAFLHPPFSGRAERSGRASPPPWMPECHCGMWKRRRRMKTRAPRSAMTGTAAAWTGTRPISSPSDVAGAAR